MDIYEVSLECEPLRGSDEFGECAGFFVFVYLASDSLRNALDSAEKWASKSGYQLLDIDHVLRINLSEYEPHDDRYPSKEELVACLESKEILTGVFYLYDARHEH